MPYQIDQLARFQGFSRSHFSRWPRTSLYRPRDHSPRHSSSHLRSRRLTFRFAISLISTQKNKKAIQYGSNSFLGPHLTVTSGEGIPIYNHDWGCGIRRPVWVQSMPSGAGVDGVGLVPPRRGGSAKEEVEIMLGFKAEETQKLGGNGV